MAYKKLIKVSNVCQVLDKSKYPATQTIKGVTFTNNGDGTITVNGTATEDVFMSAGAIGVIKGHKYLWKGTPVGGALSTFHSYITGGMEQFFIDTGSGNISTAKDDGVTYAVLARVKFSTTVSNLTFKPQLFDLTEMYGAGHEPTTVEQFRQDFPDEMYDYSPYCWLTSYKRVFMTGGGNYLTSYQRSLTCKTKNLFDYTTVRGLKNTTTGASINNYLKINGVSFTVIYSAYSGGTHILPSFILKAGTYTLSLIAKGTAPGNKGVFGIVKFNSDGTVTSFSGRWTSSDIRQSYTFTLDEDSEVALRLQGYGNASNYLNLDSTFTNIQLELGDTATDYVPYGHL